MKVLFVNVQDLLNSKNMQTKDIYKIKLQTKNLSYCILENNKYNEKGNKNNIVDSIQHSLFEIILPHNIADNKGLNKLFLNILKFKITRIILKEKPDIYVLSKKILQKENIFLCNYVKGILSKYGINEYRSVGDIKKNIFKYLENYINKCKLIDSICKCKVLLVYNKITDNTFELLEGLIQKCKVVDIFAQNYSEVDKVKFDKILSEINNKYGSNSVIIVDFNGSINTNYNLCIKLESIETFLNLNNKNIEIIDLTDNDKDIFNECAIWLNKQKDYKINKDYLSYMMKHYGMVKIAEILYKLCKINEIT